MQNRKVQSMIQSKKRSPQSNAKVEVEVSLDVLSQLYSIVVTEASNLQSIVSVPSKGGGGDGGYHHHHHHHGKRSGGSSSDGNSSVENTPGRLADCLRPSSPMPRSRHSALLPPQQERGRPRSLPPRIPSTRGDRRPHHLYHGATSRVIRDLSSPPSFDATTTDHGNPERRNKNAKQSNSRTNNNSNTNKTKPNLVSKIATRRSLFGRPKATRQIIPALY